ncbi:MAG: hypothetical protein ACM3MG_05345 [Bacillota bacterium]
MTLVLTTLLLSINASAALLTNEASSNKLEKVVLSSAATYNLENEPVKLSEVGAGLRAKKVVFVNIKVYIGELFASDLSKFNKENPLPSLKDQKAVAIQLHFLRSVDAENVQKSFKEALKANDINLDDVSIKQFLDAVAKGGESKDGKTLTIVGAKLKNGSEQISYETTSGITTEIKGTAGLVEKIFSIWLGKPADDGVAHLKKSILK